MNFLSLTIKSIHVHATNTWIFTKIEDNFRFFMSKKEEKGNIVIYPFSEAELISARKRSPALRWVNPKFSTIFAH